MVYSSRTLRDVSTFQMQHSLKSLTANTSKQHLQSYSASSCSLGALSSSGSGPIEARDRSSWRVSLLGSQWVSQPSRSLYPLLMVRRHMFDHRCSLSIPLLPHWIVDLIAIIDTHCALSPQLPRHLSVDHHRSVRVESVRFNGSCLVNACRQPPAACHGHLIT